LLTLLFRAVYPVSPGMARRDEVAGRMAEAVVKRLVGRKLADVRDEARAREVVRRILAENFQAEEKIDADARTLLMDNAKLIRDSASDYKRLFAMVKTKLAKERGFTL
jgi:hypothetical protein